MAAMAATFITGVLGIGRHSRCAKKASFDDERGFSDFRRAALTEVFWFFSKKNRFL